MRLHQFLESAALNYLGFFFIIIILGIIEYCKDNIAQCLNVVFANHLNDLVWGICILQ